MKTMQCATIVTPDGNEYKTLRKWGNAHTTPKHEKGIPPAIPEVLTDDHETSCIVRKKTIIFFFAYCRCSKPTYSPPNFHLDTSKYRQIQICDTCKICSHY